MKRLPLLACAAACTLFSALSARAADEKAGGVTVDKEKRTVTLDCKIAPRKLPALQEIYPIEVIACWGHAHKPPGKKAHETIITFDAKPSEIHKALEELGVKPGKPVF